jgi:hypothetical protein
MFTTILLKNKNWEIGITCFQHEQATAHKFFVLNLVLLGDPDVTTLQPVAVRLTFHKILKIE